MPSWPRRFVHDAAYLLLPFSFVVFLILLGGALLITWGDLSNAVLIGFCVTAGLLVGGFLLCHLVLYCTSADAAANSEEQGGGSSTPTTSSLTTSTRRPASGGGGGGGPKPSAGSKMVCADCHGRRHAQDGLFRRDGARGHVGVKNQAVRP